MKHKRKLFYLLFSLIIVISSILIVSCNDSGEPSITPTETEALKVPTNIKIDTRILTWNAVENASGYVVDFNGTERTVEDTALDLHFYIEGGRCYVKVKAIGDNINYSDSEWSQATNFKLSERVATGYDENTFYYTLLEDGSGYELTRAKKTDNNLDGEVIIPDYFCDYPVKRIGDYAFTLKGYAADFYISGASNTVTTAIKLPTHLESIGKGAFACIANLTEIVIPDTVTEIGEKAFSGCKQLTRVVLPKNLKIIPDCCFENTALSEISLPEVLEEIGVKAFECQYYENINGIVHITSKLSSIVVPNSVKNIGNRAFYGRENLKYITLPDTVEEFGEETFHETKWYNEHPDGMVLLGVGECYLYEYKGEIPGDGVIDTLPSNIKGLCPYAFRGTNLTKIVIPDGVKFLGEFALAYAENLSEVVLPSDLETIKSLTFAGATGLKNITLPQNLKTIESSAFTGSGLERIVIPETVTVIERLAFYDCKALAEVILPSTLTRIERNTFSGTKSLKAIVLPESLTYIGESAFYGSGIEKITVQKHVKTIENSVFNSCKALTEINLPEELLSIGDSAFRNCSALKEIILPSSLESIGNYAFNNCVALKEIILPASLKSIGSPIIASRATMFQGCESLTHIYYDGAFDKLTSITKDVDFPNELVYTYAAQKPEAPGNYWHYVDGKITVWTYE